MEKMRRLIHYDLRGWVRKSSEELDDYVEKKIGVCRGGAFFATIHNKDGGEHASNNFELIDFAELAAIGDVYAADVYLADTVISANRFVPEWADDYIRSIVSVSREEEIPVYKHWVEERCWCGCGKVEWAGYIDFTEVFTIPPYTGHTHFCVECGRTIFSHAFVGEHEEEACDECVSKKEEGEGGSQ